MLVNSFPGSLSTEYRTWDKQMGRWCSKTWCGYVRIGPPRFSQLSGVFESGVWRIETCILIGKYIDVNTNSGIHFVC